MYCQFCGKQIADNSVYCQYCGKSLKLEGPSPLATEWVSRDFIFSFPVDATWCRIGVGAYTEAGAKLEFWQEFQQAIRVELQKWVDEGWEPISEIGPAGINITYLRKKDRARPTQFRCKTRIEKEQSLKSAILANAPGTIRIERTRKYLGSVVGYDVIINEQKIGVLGNGEIISQEVKRGAYNIQIRAGFAKSEKLEFEINSTEEIRFLADTVAFGDMKLKRI